MKGVGKPMLEGLKIIELGMAVAGPVIVSYFCHYGATAVRVESSKKIDSMRTTPPYWQRKPGINRSLHVSNLNANKYSILLDLKTEKGKEIFRKLTRWADIIVENYRAGTLKKLGLGYEDLVKENDRLIMVSTTTQGQTGPYAKKVAGFGLHVESMAGFVNITGWPDREAVLGGGLQTDYISGKYSVAALIAALIHRNKTGRGQYIDVSHIESTLHFLEPLILDYTVNGHVAQRRGNECPHAAPHNVYPCKGEDKWCTISVFSDMEWEGLCEVMGQKDLSQDKRFDSLMSRKKNEGMLDQIIREWTSKYEQKELFESLQSKGICAGIVKDAKQAYEDPQLNWRGHWQEVDHPEIGKHKIDLPGIRLSKNARQQNRPGPCLGEHTVFVCTELLGLSDEEFVQLEQAGIFQ